jgi:hypothetical protein
MTDPDRQEAVAIDRLQQHDRLLADHVEADAVDLHLLQKGLPGGGLTGKSVRGRGGEASHNRVVQPAAYLRQDGTEDSTTPRDSRELTAAGAASVQQASALRRLLERDQFRATKTRQPQLAPAQLQGGHLDAELLEVETALGSQG